MSQLYITHQSNQRQKIHNSPIQQTTNQKEKITNPQSSHKEISSEPQIHSHPTDPFLLQIVQKLKCQQDKNQKMASDLHRTQSLLTQLSHQVQQLSSKPKTIKTITIKAVKHPSDPPKQDTGRVKILQEQLAKYHSQNTQLKQALLVEKTLNKDLANSLRREQEKYNKLIHKFDEKVGCLNRDIKRYEERIEQLVRELKDYHDVERSSQLNHQTAPVYNLIAHHPRNAHQAYYTLKKASSTQAHITHSGPNGYYNLVNKVQILPHQSVTYSVRIQQVQNNWILVGFCTGRGFGNANNYLHAESVYYYAFSGGYLFQGGVKREALEGSSVGDTIHCLADLPNGNFLWLKDKNEVGRCKVPPQMKGRKIYFSVLLYSKDDQIDIYI